MPSHTHFGTRCANQREQVDGAQGLFIPAMVFLDIRDIDPEAVCLVLASTHYDMSRSIRSYEAFLEAVAQS